nr:MAG TPA: hypothetical protein [Caudoviricetes sp.]
MYIVKSYYVICLSCFSTKLLCPSTVIAIFF